MMSPTGTAETPDLLADPAAEHGPLLSPGERFGRYSIRESLGKNAVWAAYRAQESSTAPEVTLRVLSPRLSDIPGLDNYVRAVAQRDYGPLEHPGLARLHYAGVSAGRIYVSRAYAAGGSAQERIDAGHRFSADEVFRIVRGIAPALHYVHQRGLVHQNLKPANLLFDADGNALLADAGMPGLLEAIRQAYLASGALLVAPVFQAQEQLAGKAVTVQTDVYGLAATLYALLTGSPPCAAAEPPTILEQQLIGDPPSAAARNAAVPPELDQLLQRAMDFAPARRPATMAAFADELGIRVELPAESAAGPLVEEAEPEAKPGPSGRPPPQLPARAHAPKVRIGDQFARLTIRNRLALTPIATVFRASDSADKRQVVFKILGPEFETLPKFAEYFRHVVQRFAQYTHSNLVTLIGGGRSHGYLYYAVPYLEGGTLADRLAPGAEGPFDQDAAIAVVKDIAGALSHLHQEGVVHQDIKPGNVHFNAEGRAFLSEVGVGPMLYAAASTFVEPSRLGPIAYRSPEQLAGRRKGSALDARSDMYSLGVLLFEMLTGRTPFDAADTSELAMLQFTSAVPSARQARPPELAPLSREVDEVLRVALSYSPKGRFASVAEFMSALTGTLPLELPASDVISAEPAPEVALPRPPVVPPAPAVEPPVIDTDELLQLDLPPRAAPLPEDESLMQLDTLQLLGEAAAPAAAVPAIPVPVPVPVPRPRVTLRPVLLIGSVLGLIGVLGIGGFLALAGRGLRNPQTPQATVVVSLPDDASEGVDEGAATDPADPAAPGGDADAPAAGDQSDPDDDTSSGAGDSASGEAPTVEQPANPTATPANAGVAATALPSATNGVSAAGPTSATTSTSTATAAPPSPTASATPAPPTATPTPSATSTPTPEPTETSTPTETPSPTIGPAPGEDPDMAQAELEIVSLSNGQRASRGVSPALLAESSVMAVAQGRSDDMGARNYFSHNDPVTGSVPAFDQLAGYGAVGENLFIISGSAPVDELAGQAISSWMSSPGHRSNILDPAYEFIGVGVAFDDTCPGYGECWLVTQLFASEIP